MGARGEHHRRLVAVRRRDRHRGHHPGVEAQRRDVAVNPFGGALPERWFVDATGTATLDGEYAVSEHGVPDKGTPEYHLFEIAKLSGSGDLVYVQKAANSPEKSVIAARRYIEARAVAILLRRAGLDAVPLLLREPATAILVDGQVVAVVNEVEREVAVSPGYADEEHLRNTLYQNYQQLFEMSREIPEARFERYAAILWARVRGPSTKRAPSVETPPDLQAKSWRTEANLKAMRLVLTKEPGEFTLDDLAVLATYSGWGGLSIEGVKKKIPKDLVPESFGLIHEYYSPTRIAKSMAVALCPMLPELAGNDGIVRALEPSAGAAWARAPRSDRSRSRGSSRAQTDTASRSSGRGAARGHTARHPDLPRYGRAADVPTGQ